MSHPIEIAEKIKKGDVPSLARAITLVESKNPYKRKLGSQILRILASSGHKSSRIGITGIPGAGKSTLIESIGLDLIRRGEKVAVLSIDPSSTLSGGSILGDKTRMPRLSAHPNSFIRPSPNQNIFGGLGPHTFETIFLCEAAGYSYILMETVGTGQSESEIAFITDMLILVNVAGQGDDLQGIKRGVMELSDLLVINKTDEPEDTNVLSAVQFLTQAIKLLPERPHKIPVSILTVSSYRPETITLLTDKIEEFIKTIRNEGYLETSRALKIKNVFIQYIKNMHWHMLESKKEVSQAIDYSIAELVSKPYTIYELTESLLSKISKC